MNIFFSFFIIFFTTYLIFGIGIPLMTTLPIIGMVFSLLIGLVGCAGLYRLNLGYFYDDKKD